MNSELAKLGWPTGKGIDKRLERLALFVVFALVALGAYLVVLGLSGPTRQFPADEILARQDAIDMLVMVKVEVDKVLATSGTVLADAALVSDETFPGNNFYPRAGLTLKLFLNDEGALSGTIVAAGSGGAPDLIYDIDTGTIRPDDTSNRK